MSKETPLQTVKRVYGSKDKLVDSVTSALQKLGEDADDLKERLTIASNKKLLHLAAVTKDIQERYGSRDKLVDAILTALGKVKDSDYGTKLSSLPLPRLLDLVRSAEKHAGRKKAA